MAADEPINFNFLHFDRELRGALTVALSEIPTGPERGWWYLPQGPHREPVGPFDTEDAATLSARRWTPPAYENEFYEGDDE